MTTTEMDAPAHEPAVEPNGAMPEAPAQRWLAPTFGVIAVLLIGAGVYFREPLGSIFVTPEPSTAPAACEPVSVVERNVIAVAPNSPLKKRLSIVPAFEKRLEYPRLNATGYVMARLAPGQDKADRRWDFASPEVATAYGDWLNASADVAFYKEQADNTTKLVKVRVEFLKNEFERKLKNRNALPERDLVAAEADYLQGKIQGQKDTTDADTALKKADRNRGLLERQLLQAGVDPEVVQKATKGLVLVVADVPEAKIHLVKPDQACQATFFGVPNHVFDEGKVGRLGPSVGREKRTLRVTFELVDKSGKLLPGMFGDIGLDTEKRDVLMVPADAVLHAGDSDYVLKQESADTFRAIEIKVDEPRWIRQPDGSLLSCIPVLEGKLEKNDRVVGTNAVLLKPILVKALGIGNGH
ncbi:MAG: efflux RND transporter periplasmic adaptor subunit [Planctomycetes bacterium]|nr:efflux RND transporter periplasmic adaptor subunit [Planctomycetota bacterium]